MQIGGAASSNTPASGATSTATIPTDPNSTSAGGDHLTTIAGGAISNSSTIITPQHAQRKLENPDSLLEQHLVDNTPIATTMPEQLKPQTQLQLDVVVNMTDANNGAVKCNNIAAATGKRKRMVGEA
jgi:hypothetical protein